MFPRSFFTFALFTLPSAFWGCQSGPDQAIVSDKWQYPLTLGAQRSKVHTLLGDPHRLAPDLEVYPQSGVSIRFDSEDRATKLSFTGPACSVRISDTLGLIPSGRRILQGLTVQSDLAAYRYTLGAPIIDDVVDSGPVPTSRCVWRGDGLVVTGYFLDSAHTCQGKTYPKGTLAWLDIFKGL